MSARTAKYVEAIIREGDNFDYVSWLRKVREEESQANPRLAASDSRLAAAAEIGNRLSASLAGLPERRGTAAPMAKTVPVPRAVSRSGQDLSGTTSKDQLRRWLKKVQVAWQEFQANRARDAVYDYLQAVFAIVMHFKVRRRTNRLLRHAFRFAGLRTDKKADPFTAIIRCTCGEAADTKLISKWARALRYAARRKPPETRLTAFMKDMGGVNECATGYANQKRRSSGRN